MTREMLSRRRFLQVALAAITGSLAAACTSSPPPSPTAKPADAPKPGEPTKATAPAAQAPAAKPAAPAASSGGGKTLTVGFNQEPQILDPVSNTAASFQTITASTIEQLIYFGGDSSNFEPGLATSWKWVDPTTFELKLRQGVKFSNGEEFDAESAAYSIKLLIESKAYAMWTTDLAEAKVVDKQTVHLKTKKQTGLALGALARGGFVYPAKYHKEVGPDKFGTAPIGTGPYKFTEWQKGSRIVFDANPGYWGGAPKLARIVWRIIPEEAPRVAALQAGEVQLITNLSNAASSRIKGDSKLDLVSRPGLRMFGSFFDMQIDHPVKNKLVRQAMNYAIDKDALIKLYGGDATVMQGQWLTPLIAGFNPNLKPYPFDQKKAKELLTQAGYPNGFEMTLSYTIDRYPLDKEMGQAVAGYLEGVGIKVTQQALEYGKFRDNFRGGPGKAGPVYQWALLTPPDPGMTLNMWGKSSVDYRRWPDDPVADPLLEQGAAETDEKKRVEIYQKLVAHWYEDPFCIYLIIPNDLYGKSKSLQGWSARADQVVDLRTATLE